MTLIFIIVVIYLAFISVLINTVKTLFLLSQHDIKSKVNISIVIAAKNEEKNLPRLITALSKQKYPDDFFEVIIVDDNSTDSTFETGRNLIKDLKNFSICRVKEKRFEGKKGALQFGIEMAKNPYILITDADCSPEDKWIQAFADKFYLHFDFVFGVAPFHETGNFTNRISCFENLRTTLLTLTAAKLKLPYSAAARSFGFSKDSFHKIAGYANTTETLSGDDDLLLREAVKHKMKIEVIADKDAFVYSETVITLKGYLKQKARHTSTSVHYLFSHKLFLGSWHLLNLFFLVSPVFIFISNKFLILFFIKLFGDLSLVLMTQKYFNYHFNFIEIILQQIIYEFMLILNLFNANFKKIEWK